jgi:translation initiation factor 3 subunit C
VFGNLLAFLGRLHDELVKAWQFTEAGTQDYILRLQDELFLIALAERMRALFTAVGARAHGAVVALRVLEHLYYKRTMPVLPESLHATPAAVKLDDDAAAAAAAAAAAGAGMEAAPVAAVAAAEPAAAAAAAPADAGSKADGAAALAGRVGELCALVYAHGDERVRVQAHLCEIFHHALHDRFYRARAFVRVQRAADDRRQRRATCC